MDRPGAGDSFRPRREEAVSSYPDWPQYKRPCKDCLALAKILLRVFPPGNLIHDDLAAFVGEVERGE